MDMKHLSQVVLAGLLLASLAVLVTERGRVAGLRMEKERLLEELVAAQGLVSAQETGQRLSSEAREDSERGGWTSNSRFGTGPVLISFSAIRVSQFTMVMLFAPALAE